MNDERGGAVIDRPLTYSLGKPVNGKRPKQAAVTMPVPIDMQATVRIDLYHDGDRFRAILNQSGDLNMYRHGYDPVTGKDLYTEMFHNDRVRPVMSKVRQHLLHIASTIPDEREPRGARGPTKRGKK